MVLEFAALQVSFGDGMFDIQLILFSFRGHLRGTFSPLFLGLSSYFSTIRKVCSET